MGRSALARGQHVAGGFAVDDAQQLRKVPLQIQGDAGAEAIRLLAHHAQEGEVAAALRQQQADGLHHGGEDPLGVAGAAAPETAALPARGKVGRHRVQVRGEEQLRLAPGGQEVAAAALHGLPQHAGTEVAEHPGEQRDHAGLVPGGGIHLAELQGPLGDALGIGGGDRHGIHPA